MESITEMADVHEIGAEQVESLHEMLRPVPDYRHRRGRRYKVATVLVILLLAKLACESIVSGMAHWSRLRESWLKAALGLKRLPCTNTYHYVCAHVDVNGLYGKVRRWLRQVAPQQQPGKLVQWAIDSKVLRGSHQRTPVAQSGKEVLNVYATDSGILQHCQSIASKGYEAATAYNFIKQSQCEGIVLTADALHTRPRFCRRIHKQKGHCICIVKANRAELEAEIRYLFALPALSGADSQDYRSGSWSPHHSPHLDQQ